MMSLLGDNMQGLIEMQACSVVLQAGLEAGCKDGEDDGADTEEEGAEYEGGDEDEGEDEDEDEDGENADEEFGEAGRRKEVDGVEEDVEWGEEEKEEDADMMEDDELTATPKRAMLASSKERTFFEGADYAGDDDLHSAKCAIAASAAASAEAEKEGVAKVMTMHCQMLLELCSASLPRHFDSVLRLLLGVQQPTVEKRTDSGRSGLGGVVRGILAAGGSAVGSAVGSVVDSLVPLSPVVGEPMPVHVWRAVLQVQYNIHYAHYTRTLCTL
jgi:hypothetical protein